MLDVRSAAQRQDQLDVSRQSARHPRAQQVRTIGEFLQLVDAVDDDDRLAPAARSHRSGVADVEQVGQHRLVVGQRLLEPIF